MPAKPSQLIAPWPYSCAMTEANAPSPKVLKMSRIHGEFQATVFWFGPQQNMAFATVPQPSGVVPAPLSS